MTAAEYQKTHHSPLIPLLAKFDELAAADQYRALAETYAAFIKEHETTRYLASEPVPFKISDHLVRKYGSSSFTTYTLRHATWSSDLRQALDKGADAFVALLGDIETQVAEIAKGAKKPN
ncbi:hypothetical protein G3545_05540 [Starkeya sp. ORNL1]|uniref:hypothetical protein n=1 Tax=Starkeya sp. ORNL1 TaxID=2709380 RepID=UPI0014648265|nr:hypothetical protein [Starkeya sp. ORNL1]QJP13159.1 hypothetical protein G3545_05540 [Starkeya sp. ORNL1]